ncbi:hypothetical protein GFL21_17895 [Rhizobium anhuiense]|uniref:hypothetical protein n=1 Tax=Rhizobium anhuiense TaxID=1184720 RepID=UPI0014422418|nr:hypothetical protein [Rhizobium anhuiense]NKM56367.1 hypothetical protein [Rhizobium anhuiense]
MKPFDGKAFGAEIVSVVKDYLRREVEPLQARIAALEAVVGKAKTKPRIAASSMPIVASGKEQQ